MGDNELIIYSEYKNKVVPDVEKLRPMSGVVPHLPNDDVRLLIVQRFEFSNR